MNTKDDLLMRSLSEFFMKRKNINQILPILSQKSKISLRILDWFVTNYSKKNMICYKINTVENFNVYINYKAQLKSYSKKQFDPFCRRNRIKFYYTPEQTNDKCIETTVGQLCFFRWSIQNKILDYVSDNFQDIEKEMIESLKKNRVTQTGKSTEMNEAKGVKSETDKVPKEKKKRSPLSFNASKKYTKKYEKIIVTFD